MLTSTAATNLRTHLQRRAATYLKVCRNLEEVANTVQSLKRYVSEGEVKKSGSKLITLGVALITFPEPIISNALGTALLAAGLYKRKIRKIGVKDVYEEVSQALEYIKDTQRTLADNTFLPVYLSS